MLPKYVDQVHMINIFNVVIGVVVHAAVECRRSFRLRAPSSPERGRYIGGVCKMYRYLHYIYPFMTCKPAMLVSNCQNQKCMFSNICYRTYITGKVRTGHKLCNNINVFYCFILKCGDKRRNSGALDNDDLRRPD